MKNSSANFQMDTFRAGYREGRIEARVSMIRRMRRMGLEWKHIEMITGIGWEDYRDLRDFWPEQAQ